MSQAAFEIPESSVELCVLLIRKATLNDAVLKKDNKC